MAIFSFAGEGSQTMEQMLKSKMKGDISVEDQLDLISDHMKHTGINNLEQALADLKELGVENLKSYGTYAGRMMRRLENEPNGEQLMQAMGLPDYNVIKEMGGRDDWALGNLSGAHNRFVRGGQKELNQMMYGVGKVEEWIRDEGPEFVENLPGALGDIDLVPGEIEPYSDERKAVQQQRKDSVADAKLGEDVWASYNAVEDEESATGLDRPWNVAGTGGEVVPGMAAGFGSGAIYKGAGQMFGAAGINTLIESLKYQEHRDKIEAGIGIGAGVLEFIPGVGQYLKSLNPVRKGQMIKNFATNTAAGGQVQNKADLPFNQADRGHNAWKLVNDKMLTVPYVMAENPKGMASKIVDEKRALPMVNMQNTIAEIYKRGSLVFEQGLGNIGPSKSVLAQGVPDVNKARPYGYNIRKYIQLQKQKLSELGDPYRKAYRDQGEKITLDTTEMLDMAKNNLKDPSAIEHLNRSVRGVTKRETQYSKDTLKRIDELTHNQHTYDKRINKFLDAEGFDKEQIGIFQDELKNLQATLNDLPEEASQAAIDKLNTQIRSKGLQLSKKAKSFANAKSQYGKDVSARNAGDFEMKGYEETGGMLDLENLTANQLVDVIENLNQELTGSATFSGKMTPRVETQLKNWRASAKAKLSELDPSFSVPYNKAKEIESTSFKLFGDQSPIKGFKEALEDKKSDKALEGLFKGDEGLTNLSHMGEWMPSSNETYRGLVRQNIEGRIDHNVLKQGDSAFPNMFDFEMFAENTKDINWDDFRKLLPKGQTQGVDYLSGLSGFDDAVLGGQHSKILNAMKNQKDPYDLKDTPIKDAMDTAHLFMNKAPYHIYDSPFPNWRQSFINQMRKTKGPEYQKPILFGPKAQSDMYEIPYIGGRIGATGSDVVVPVKQGGEGLNILTDPNYQGTEYGN